MYITSNLSKLLEKDQSSKKSPSHIYEEKSQMDIFLYKNISSCPQEILWQIIPVQKFYVK